MGNKKNKNVPIEVKAPIGTLTDNPAPVYVVNTSAIIGLNQELTEENSRLLQRVDELHDMVAKSIEIKEELYNELNTIKSKWWYKIMAWSW